MARKYSNETRLKIVAGFADEDDRTINMPNPNDDVTEADIRALEPYATSVLLGDKYGATFTRFKTASIINASYVDSDLEN